MRSRVRLRRTGVRQDALASSTARGADGPPLFHPQAALRPGVEGADADSGAKVRALRRGLATLCERHGIPTPLRGCWARKQAGHKVAKAPLIELEGARDTHVIAHFARAKPDASALAAPDPLFVFWQTQRAEIGDIKAPQTLANPHPVIAQWLNEDEDYRAVQARWGSALGVSRPTSLERRRLRILSALYKALDARGVSVHCARGARIVELRHQRDTASFDLREYVQQKRRPLTEEERADHWNANSKYRVEHTSTNLLRGKVPAYLPARVPTTWTETENTPFESMLGEIVATLFTALAHAKAQREEREEAERRRWDAQQAAGAAAKLETAGEQEQRKQSARGMGWRAGRLCAWRR